MKFVPHNQHTREAYQCEELALDLYRRGHEDRAEFWWRVRDAKFEDAMAEAEIRKREARLGAYLDNKLRRIRSGDCADDAVGAGQDDGWKNL